MKNPINLLLAVTLLLCSSFSAAQIQNDQTVFGKRLSSGLSAGLSADHETDTYKCKKCR